jgi:hypothetical protein
VFTSDRENQSNLFRYDLDTGLITQMTDLQGSGRPGGCVCEANNALHFGWQGAIHELNLKTLEERVLWQQTAPMLARNLRVRGRANPTADGKYVCVMLMEDQPEDKPAISFSYSRFREFFHLKPRTQIARIEVATGEKPTGCGQLDPRGPALYGARQHIARAARDPDLLPRMAVELDRPADLGAERADRRDVEGASTGR